MFDNQKGLGLGMNWNWNDLAWLGLAWFGLNVCGVVWCLNQNDDEDGD
jgi:hypothetical protein